MATKVFDNFLEDKYLDELNDYNIWQLVAKQDIKWVDIHSKPTNVFERIIKKEYHKKKSKFTIANKINHENHWKHIDFIMIFKDFKMKFLKISEISK